MSEGYIAVIVLIVTNIGLVAFSYGKLTQKVKDLCRRVDKLERSVNSKKGG